MKKRTFKTEMKLNLAEPALNKNNTLEEYTEQLLDENEYYNVKAICSIAFIMNVNEETKQKFFVNTQGYSYARYCLFD